MALGPFRLEERSGRPVTSDDLADRVAIASFIFTRCPLSCPRISGVMQGLQGRLARTNVLMVSISVDPEHDTPSVLRSYAERFDASPDRWWFLTGSKPLIYGLIRDRFQLGVIEAPGPSGSDTEAIVHSDRLALIDRGRIVGFFESNDAEALDALVFQARRRALPPWVARLPSVNAGLNGLSACLLLAGWLLIRRYRFRLVNGPETAPIEASPEATVWAQPLIRGHIACMVSAVGTSALFLVCYLYYHYRAGSMPFGQGGWIRVAYLSILLSHTLLATASVPLILITLWRGWRGRLDRHAAVASVTLPIWLYVAVTGVVVYLMLYHLPATQVGSFAGP
jgi:protein SCO1/2/putative membrane protein